MLSKEAFVEISFEMNLFFQRIMKEHLFFIEINLQPVASVYIKEARELKKEFEDLLSETAYHSNGVISEDAIKSHQFVTPYTLKAEVITSKLTGEAIDQEITKEELMLINNSEYNTVDWFNTVIYLNDKSKNLLDRTIAYQKKLIAMSSGCEIFIALYPEMLEHIHHEAEYYMELLKALEKGELPRKTICDELNFWNNIMEEHALFMDGMLDPSAKNQKNQARHMAEVFEKFVEDCTKTGEGQIVRDSKEATGEIREYKRGVTEGLLECKIKSIIPPLLADHVLREANHYFRLLRILDGKI